MKLIKPLDPSVPGNDAPKSHRSSLLRRMCALGVFVVVVPLLNGCSGKGEGEERARVDTLETGMVVVENPASGTWGDDPAWRLTDPIKIGNADDGGPEVFGDVRSIALDGSGRVYVLDFYAQHIRVFDTDGAYLRTLGRPGQGPGEFRFVVGMRFDHTDRLWVVNQHNMRYTLFDTAGALVNEFPRRMGAEVLEWRPFFSSTGGLYDWLIYRTANRRTSGYARYDTLTGSFKDTIPSPPLPQGTPLGWGYTAATPRTWWMGVASEYRLWELTRDLDTVRVVYRDHELNPQTREQRDSARRVYRDVRRRASHNVEWDLPRNQRIFEWIVLDDRDHVWVGLSGEPDGGGTTLDIFDPQGVYLGPVSTPYRVEPRPRPVIRGCCMVFVTKDELDVAYVVRYRIARVH
jgi:hypothetical protein